MLRTIRRREHATVEGDWSPMPQLLQRIHAARGTTSLGQAQPRLAQLLSPDSLGGLDAATTLLADAIAQDRHIVVVGDFDCDGATACAVGVRGLRMLGARGATEATRVAMLNANYIKARLDRHYPVLYAGDHGRVAHELIFDVRPFKARTGID